VWLEFAAAELLLKHLDPWYFLLVTFLLATGIRWGEAAALQIKDLPLGDGSGAAPPWVYVHKTWKRIGRCGDRTKADGRKQRKDATYVWGRGRTKTDASRRRITLTQAIRTELIPLLSGRDPQAPVFTGKRGGILHNSNFSERYLLPALDAARADLASLRAGAPTAEGTGCVAAGDPRDPTPCVPAHQRGLAAERGSARGRGSAPSGTRRPDDHQAAVRARDP